MGRRLFISLVAIAMVLATRVVRAAGAATWSLDWAAPAGCPDAATVRGAVERLLGGPHESKQPLSAEARVTRRKGTWHVYLATLDGTARGERAFDSTSCHELAEVTALIVALMIDPKAVAVHATQEPPLAPPISSGGTTLASPPGRGAVPALFDPKPESEPPPDRVASLPTDLSSHEGPLSSSHAEQPTSASAGAAEPPPPPTVSADPGARSIAVVPVRARRDRLLLNANVAGGLGTLPGPALGFGGGIGWMRNPWRLTVGASYWPTTRASVPGRPAAGAGIDLLAANLTTCVTPLSLGPVAVGPCVAGEVAQMRASSSGVTSTGSGTGVWASVLFGALSTVSLGPQFALALRLDMVVPVVTPRFQLDPSETVYQSADIEGRATCMGEVRF